MCAHSSCARCLQVPAMDANPRNLSNRACAKARDCGGLCDFRRSFVRAPIKDSSGHPRWMPLHHTRHSMLDCAFWSGYYGAPTCQ